MLRPVSKEVVSHCPSAMLGGEQDAKQFRVQGQIVVIGAGEALGAHRAAAALKPIDQGSASVLGVIVEIGADELSA